MVGWLATLEKYDKDLSTAQSFFIGDWLVSGLYLGVDGIVGIVPPGIRRCHIYRDMNKLFGTKSESHLVVALI